MLLCECVDLLGCWVGVSNVGGHNSGLWTREPTATALYSLVLMEQFNLTKQPQANLMTQQCVIKFVSNEFVRFWVFIAMSIR